MKESKEMAENSALDKVRVVGSEKRGARGGGGIVSLQVLGTPRPAGQESVH